MPEQVPSRLGKYSIVGVVGPWTMGWLYRGRDDLLGADVWVKTLSPTEADFGSAQPFLSMHEARARFEREDLEVH
jgi:hypothetical protein